MIDKSKIVIATPMIDSCRPWYTLSLWRTLKAFPEIGSYVQTSYLYVHSARWMLVGLAKQQVPDLTGIIWIDSDISWQPEDIDRILIEPEVAVGAIYVSRKTDSYAAALTKEISPGIWDCSYLGYGFIYTPMSYFPKEEEPWFDVPWTGANFLGEDVNWCRRQGLAGRAILGLMNTKVKHEYSPGPRAVDEVQIYPWEQPGGVYVK